MMPHYKLTRHLTQKYSLLVNCSCHKHARKEEVKSPERKDTRLENGEKKLFGCYDDSFSLTFTFKAFS